MRFSKVLRLYLAHQHELPFKEEKRKSHHKSLHKTKHATRSSKKHRERSAKKMDTFQSLSKTQAVNNENNSAATRPISVAAQHPTLKTRTSLLQKMQTRLIGGQFRMLNEKLYTCSGDDALQLFQDDLTAFQLYHAGYQEQMSQWPRQPVEIIIEWLQEHSSHLVVADFGCGDGRLARSVRNKVFSMDLVALHPSIIVGNMAHTPLRTASVDVAVFCLSLMGTDYSEYLKEAHRLLKPRGILLIVEVRSRFDPRTGGTDPQLFIQAVNRLGFSSVLKDFSEKMFIMFHFQRKMDNTMAVNDIEWPVLKPCIYKRR